MVPLKATRSVRVNKIALLFLTVIAFIVGVTPATLVISRLELIMFFTIAALVVNAYTLHHFESLATEKPSFLEYVIGWMGAIFWGAFIGFLLLVSYLISLGGVHLFEFVGTSLGFEMQLDAQFIAYVISLVTAIILILIFVWYGAEVCAIQLYPSKGHVKSAFYELVTYGRRRLIGYMVSALLVLGGIVGVLITTGSLTVWWFNLLVLTYLLILSFSPMSMGETYDPILPKAIKAVGKLFGAMGYQVVPFPATGEPSFDPLLVGLDFFIQNKEHFLATVVRMEESRPKDQWTPSDLLRSAWALETFLQEETNRTQGSVIPLVVYIGKKKEKWKEKKVKIMKIPDSRLIEKILEMDNQEDLKKIASRYLRFSRKGENMSASKDNLNISGGEA